MRRIRLGSDWLVYHRRQLVRAALAAGLYCAVLSVAFTAFAVGSVANVINIIDGFNGLAAGTSIIILADFGLMASELGDTDLANVALILGAAILGFGLVNWPFVRMFWVTAKWRGQGAMSGFH